MKKIAVIAVSALLTGLIAFPVFARGWGYCGGGPHMGGPCSSACLNTGGADLNDEQKGKLEELDRKFFESTSGLRTAVQSKAAEIDKALAAADPDPESLKTLQKELSDIKAQLAQEQLNFRLEAKKIAPDAANCYCGNGPRCGMGMGGGRHRGPCWN